jgi:hypothetical protein
MRVVPVVVRGSGAVADGLLTKLQERAGDLAGREGFDLQVADDFGSMMSLLVDVSTYDAFESFEARSASVVSAVEGGHGAVVADVRLFASDIRTWAILSSDQVVGMSAALLPEVPLVQLLGCVRDGAPAPEAIIFDGDDPARLADEAVAICRLTGVELGRERVVVECADGDTQRWEVHIERDRFPVVAALTGAWSGRRRVLTRFASSELSLTGTAVHDEGLAELLWADVVRLARQGDRPWRAHRRLVAAT